MTILESLFSELASQFVPGSVYAPKTPVLNTVEDHQLASGTENGYVKFIWTPVVNNEEVTEFLIVADGDPQFAETLVDSVVASSYSMSAATLAGSATTLSASAAKGATSIDVVDGSQFVAGDWIVLDVLGTDVRKRELIKVDSVSTNTLEIGTTKPEGLMVAHASGESVQEVTLTAKTETTDYTITIATGEIELVDDKFTNGQLVFLTYTSTNSSFSHYNIYRNDSNDFASATLQATATSKSTSGIDINHQNQGDEGQTYYYWVTAVDAENNESRPAKVENATNCYSGAFDTIPTRPQDVHSTVSIGKVNLFWDGTIAGNWNLDGYEVYRLGTSTNFDVDATKINSGYIPNNAGETISYEDSTVVTGNTYYYKIVATDDDSTNTSDSTRQGNVSAAVETKTVLDVN